MSRPVTSTRGVCRSWTRCGRARPWWRRSFARGAGRRGGLVLRGQGLERSDLEGVIVHEGGDAGVADAAVAWGLGSWVSQDSQESYLPRHRNRELKAYAALSSLSFAGSVMGLFVRKQPQSAWRCHATALGRRHQKSPSFTYGWLHRVICKRHDLTQAAYILSTSSTEFPFLARNGLSVNVTG